MAAFNCPCCGDRMEPVEEMERSTKYKCRGCGLSDTRLKAERT